MHRARILAWLVALGACGSSSTGSAPAEPPEPSIAGVAPLRDFEISQSAMEMGVVLREVDTLVVRSDGTLKLQNRRGELLRTLRVPPAELDRIARMAAAPWFTRIRSRPLEGEGSETTISLRSPTRSHSASFSDEGTPEARVVLRELYRLRVMVEALAPEAASAPACTTDADCTSRECSCSRCQPRERTEPPLTPSCRPGRCARSPCSDYRPVCDPSAHRCALVRSP